MNPGCIIGKGSSSVTLPGHAWYFVIVVLVSMHHRNGIARIILGYDRPVSMCHCHSVQKRIGSLLSLFLETASKWSPMQGQAGGYCHAL